MQGLALQYTDKIGFAELVADWNGMYSAECREQFRILFSGEGHFAKIMYAGGSAEMHHYANRADFRYNVVDDIVINPYLGVAFKAFFDFDIRLGYLQSLQRDRLTGGGLEDSVWRGTLLPHESLGCLYHEQLLCRRRLAAALQLGGQGGNYLRCRPLCCRSVLPHRKYDLQPHGYWLRAQLLEGAHKGQGRVCIENRRGESLQPADYIAGCKYRSEDI